jgi:prepilin peptidase CpaA
MALGLGLLLLPWLMGGMGAGDVKALGALGAVLGPEQVFHVFLYMGLYGGVLAILHYLFARNIKAKAAEWLGSLKATVLTNDPAMIIPTKTEPLRFPYAAAIAFGYYTYLAYGGVF